MASRLYRPEQPVEGPLRWVKGRVSAVSGFMAAVVSLRPEKFEGVEPTVTALRAHLGTDRVLVELRHLAGAQLAGMDPPLGLRPRPLNAVVGPGGQFHKARGCRGPPGVRHAPDRGKRDGRRSSATGAAG